MIGERINTLSLYKGLNNWEKPTVNLDFGPKRIWKHYIFYVKINNILNTPFQLIIRQNNSGYSGKFRLPFQESPNYVTVQYDRLYARIRQASNSFLKQKLNKNETFKNS